MDKTSLIVIGIYTLVYVVVFIIQQSQIKSQKTIIESMKTFTEIFKVEDVKRFVDMREETMKGYIDNFANNNDRLKKFFNEHIKDEVYRIEKETNDKFEDKYFQLAHVTLMFMKQISADDRERFIKDQLSLSEDLFLKMLVEIESFRPENLSSSEMFPVNRDQVSK